MPSGSGPWSSHACGPRRNSRSDGPGRAGAVVALDVVAVVAGVVGDRVGAGCEVGFVEGFVALFSTSTGVTSPTAQSPPESPPSATIFPGYGSGRPDDNPVSVINRQSPPGRSTA